MLSDQNEKIYSTLERLSDFYLTGYIIKVTQLLSDDVILLSYGRRFVKRVGKDDVMKYYEKLSKDLRRIDHPLRFANGKIAIPPREAKIHLSPQIICISSLSNMFLGAIEDGVISKDDYDLESIPSTNKPCLLLLHRDSNNHSGQIVDIDLNEKGKIRKIVLYHSRMFLYHPYMQ